MKDKCYVIPVQKACNADCIFCISKTRNYNKKEEFLVPNEEFINTLHLLLSRGVNRFEITGGGEPFLNSNLQKIVYLIRTIIPHAYIKLYTNGSILRKIEGIDELDISVVSFDSDINLEFMKLQNKISLEEKLDFFRREGGNIKIRLSIPLMKGAIDSKEKLDDFINKTCGKVNEYVVRTLYPHTIDRDKYFIDFEYERENVVFERENDVNDFDGLVLWSDGKIYTNWNLDNIRNLYSYIMLKPDSQTRIADILEYIKLRGFSIKKVLHISDFVSFASNLYSDKDEKYYEQVRKHLENSAYLFGNVGLVLILDKNLDYESLIEETYLLKKELRSLFSFTHTKNGYLLQDGNISHLNVVHAPDAKRENYERDLKFIESKPLEDVTGEEMELILKHRSYFV